VAKRQRPADQDDEKGLGLGKHDAHSGLAGGKALQGSKAQAQAKAQATAQAKARTRRK
jgi:hypothetical protein